MRRVHAVISVLVAAQVVVDVPDLYLICQLLLLPLLALVAAAVRRDRTSLALLAAVAAHVALAVLGDATPPLAAVYAALTYTVLIVAWGGPRPSGSTVA
jgi:hypothetical protein